MLTALIAGFALGGSLIVAIGAQNAFVIRQGALNNHVFPVVLFCTLSDIILIWAGVYGLGALLKLFPDFITLMRWGGAAFLIWYGIKAFTRALHPDALREALSNPLSLSAALATCAAFTWLNPHVYLDTVVLVGSIANARPPGQQWPFALGASLASTVWFFSLGYGARALGHILARPSVWRMIDLAIAAIMFALAAKLIFG
jgi:L-lysine exporter family protein LysE/ArgO